MKRMIVALAVAIAVVGVAAPAGAGVSHEGQYHQDTGGHARHSHRDWSGTEGRGHVHGPCWAHHNGQAVWICR